MKVQYVFVASLLCVLLASMPSLAAFVAYNDCVPKDGNNPANTTGYGLGVATPPNSGVLKDFATGASTGVTVTVNNSGATPDGTGPATAFAAGTDAANTFAGKVNYLNWVTYYGTSNGWYVDMVFTGLNSAMTYDITTTLDRGNSAANYLTRWTKISINDADAFTYASSAGAFKVSDAETSIVSYNTLTGYVAKWTGIRPGSDGDFTIRYTHCTGNGDIPAGATQDATRYAYGPGGFMLVETPEPMSLGLLLLGGLGLLRRRS